LSVHSFHEPWEFDDLCTFLFHLSLNLSYEIMQMQFDFKQRSLLWLLIKQFFIKNKSIWTTTYTLLVQFL
jgi:hypothetical protein